MQRREFLSCLPIVPSVFVANGDKPLQLRKGAKIRLWKLGSLEHGIMPSGDALKKLAACIEEGLKYEGGIRVGLGA